MDLQTEQLLIKQACGGNAGAFARLVDAHKNLVYNLAVHMLRNEHDAEELAQDVFVKMHQKLKDFRAEARLATWLYRVVYNLAISRLRRKKKVVFAVDSEPLLDLAQEHQVHRDVMQLETAEREYYLKLALEQLSADDRWMVMLFYWEGKSVEEIAETMQLGVSNVKVRMMRARQKLYTLLKGLLQHELQDLRF